ncbi:MULTISPECIES: M23 family metallopeptidase [Streptomyces]|uniref:Peptidase n=1 Tax=Streptomyces venezuelae TaxID=54571 RepID=A0A5P2B3P7_STRVZ|nr:MULTISPECIES: M23 family metallopeptidase [Streptomyces]NEA02800.1 M23 family metallopeptidase [Streptomyces sp. SID10116]MYY80070.1 peptidoglycan DD-metalloendopeptidase family protein [Streptomyces sp. SID335]MYZ16266.1 peptidoglycan DD-metalloendopeptidase family protein [Streptomyces sp. SID337]NDZ90853.1 M23 family metallopeptidase [Streptomyces sp. SID10115]NEB49921.1 M23 family metallopeptidase [Streptomyces sp. SID339]
MGHHIESPREAGTTRRDVLGMAAVLLAGGALTAGAAAPRADEEFDSCDADYDAEFESALADGDAEFPEDEERGFAAGPRRFTLPLRRRYRITTRYGARGNWLAGHHTGIDLAVPSGTAVYAVGGGVVVLARWSGAYGKAVTVRMPDGHYAVYGHLSRIRVRKGARVRAGTRLGNSGSTGRATGPHLHLEIRSRRHYGSDVSPYRYLARRGARLW